MIKKASDSESPALFTLPGLNLSPGGRNGPGGHPPLARAILSRYAVIYNNLCNDCWNRKDCAPPCPAMDALLAYVRVQSDADKRAYLRTLSKSLLNEAKPSKELRVLAEKVIRRFPELCYIHDCGIRIGYVVSHERKNGEKTVYADCRKLGESVRAYLPFDFLITFYEHNTGLLNENQKRLLMLHELSHIGIGQRGLRIKPHDVEDFSFILEKYGLDWTKYGKELPDILAGEIDGTAV